ncbi:unnamed protein product, partial [Schistosoma margrebowiei]
MMNKTLNQHNETLSNLNDKQLNNNNNEIIPTHNINDNYNQLLLILLLFKDIASIQTFNTTNNLMNNNNNNNKESNYSLNNNNFNQKINNSIILKQNQFIDNSCNHKECSTIFRIKELNDKLIYFKGKFIINKNINNEILLRNILSNETIKNQLYNKNFTQLIIDLNNNNNNNNNNKMKDLSLLKMFNNQSFIHLLLNINKDTILNNLTIKNIINNLDDKENRSIDHLDDYYIQKMINLTEMNTDHLITKVSNVKINKEKEYDNEIDQLIGEEQSFNEVLGNNKLGNNLIKKGINRENKNKLLTNNNKISIGKKYRRKRSSNDIDLEVFNVDSSSAENINRNNKQNNNEYQKQIKINNQNKISRRTKKDIDTYEETPISEEVTTVPPAPTADVSVIQDSSPD